MNVAILGAGVIGLTTGILLLEKYPKAKITIYAESTNNLVSHVACAQFYPIWLGDKTPKSYEHTLKKWYTYSYKRFEDLLGDEHDIKRLPNFELASSAEVPDYFYDVLPKLKITPKADLPHDFSHVIEFETLIINPTVYLKKILAYYKELGGRIIKTKFNNLDQILDLQEQIVINCLGVGASLFNDQQLKPVKGVGLILKSLPLNFVLSYDDHIIAPRQNHTFIGASYLPNNFSSTITQNEKDYLFDHIKLALEKPGHEFSLPRGTLKKQNIIKAISGFRPMRDTGPRVETELLGNKQIIHNYGHGGNGVILSWGSSQEVVSLIS